MKFSYEVIIRDETGDYEILNQMGRGTARSKKGCLKSIRRDINSTIKGMLERIEQEEVNVEE